MPKPTSLLTLITKKTLGVMCLTASLGTISLWVLFSVTFSIPT